ncbi:SDR family oxidoreductase [Rhizorhabdus argentea]|uniref:SDR family oxidoreductase n=1 Tax=Rhizorhabdus argentea TaxID=1387174 RepID=UPI0030EB1292
MTSTTGDPAAYFSGKAGVVTGASSGIGRAIATELGRAGMKLWLAGRSADALADTARAIVEGGGPQPTCVPIDLSAQGEAAALVARVGREHEHLFAVINNAGIMHPEPIMSGRLQNWRAMFDVNVLAPLEASHAAVHAMRSHGKPGHIVNISSLSGRFDAGGVYGASKCALDMISRSLRLELEHDDIRVTSIVPGGFATNLGRSLEPETLQVLGAAAANKGVDLQGPSSVKAFGDPAKIAATIRFVLEQPIELNLQEIVIRPAISLEL